MDYSSN